MNATRLLAALNAPGAAEDRIDGLEEVWVANELLSVLLSPPNEFGGNPAN